MNELFTENMNYMNLPYKVFKDWGIFFPSEKMNWYIRIKVEKWFNIGFKLLITADYV